MPEEVKKIDIQFNRRPIYQKVEEGEMITGIIARFRYPWEIEKYGLAGEFVKTWRSALHIDFLFFVLRITWETDGKKSKSGKYNEPY